MSWPSVRIKYVSSINKKTLPESTDGSYSFHYIDIGSVDSRAGIEIPKEKTEFSRAPSRARRLAPPGSTVISTVRTYLKAIAQVPETEEDLVFSTGFAVLEPTSRIDPRFLSYACLSAPFIYETIARSVGVSYPAINPSELGGICIPLPDKNSQQRIADFLDTETARIDQLVEKRQTQLSSLEERSSAVVSEMLFPGILHSPAGHYPWTWLPDPSDDVPMVRLGYVCRLQTGLTVDASREATDDDVTRPYLRVANVQADHVDLESVTSITVPRNIAERSTLRPGDVLMTEGGDLDKLGRGTVWHGELPGVLHQNHVFALRPQLDKLSPDYLALLTQSLHGRCYFESTGTRSTNLASTNSSKVLSFPIPLPSLERQKQLTKEIKTSLEAIKRARNTLHRQLALLAERRQALITAAVTGQLDGRE